MAFTFAWQWHLHTPPEQLWPLVSDTDRFNALAGLPTVEIVDDESVQAPVHLLRMRTFGQTIEWEEPPFEWVSPRWFRIVRTYRRGPVARTVVTLHLEHAPTGGSLLSVELGFDTDLVHRLTTLIRTAPDADLAHMHPILYARRWQVDEQTVIRLFLYASRVGLLELRWDVACPACQGTPISLNHLNQLEEHAHCPYCRIIYEANFEHAVQVTFRPHPSVRHVDVPVFCIGGPRKTPHPAFVGQRIPNGKKRFIRFKNGKPHVLGKPAL